MKRVSVLMGGISAEREVSLVSGANCAEALRQAGYETTTIDVGRDIGELLLALSRQSPDVVFNALHGRWGEDGNIQGLLNLLHLPYTHSGLLASAMAMDKPLAKKLFAKSGLRTPEGMLVTRAELDAGDPMARPYVVKPTNEGSSVGVSIVRQGENFRFGDGGGWRFGETALVEKFIPGRELTVGVMGDRAMAVTELRPVSGFYDYTNKYTEGMTQHLCPAPLPEDVAAEAKRMALEAHLALGCRGVSRADLRYDDTGGVGVNGLYLLEVNTQPGMTALSLVPEQARHLGISYPDLVAWMVEEARCDS